MRFYIQVLPETLTGQLPFHLQVARILDRSCILSRLYPK